MCSAPPTSAAFRCASCSMPEPASFATSPGSCRRIPVRMAWRSRDTAQPMDPVTGQDTSQGTVRRLTGRRALRRRLTGRLRNTDLRRRRRQPCQAARPRFPCRRDPWRRRGSTRRAPRRGPHRCRCRVRDRPFWRLPAWTSQTTPGSRRSPLLRHLVRHRRAPTRTPARSTPMPARLPRPPRCRARLQPLLRRSTIDGLIRRWPAFCLGRIEKRPGKPGRSCRNSNVKIGAYAACFCCSTAGALPLIGIRRGFLASGISRTRSTCSSPFSRLAPLT
jgi:hypothetical protein